MKWLPHIHNRQTDTACLLLAQLVLELVHAGFRAVLVVKPDRVVPNQVAHHDVVGMPFTNGNLVDPDNLRARDADLHQLRCHVVLVEFLDGLPVQMQFLGNILDFVAAVAAPAELGEPLRVERVAYKNTELLALHFSATSTENSSNLQFQIDPRVATGQIPQSQCRLVVPTRARPSILLAGSFLSAVRT